ncbi:MAG: mechanosensitive ion channel domain-containing protein [Gemmatimonadaceae bacterium]
MLPVDLDPCRTVRARTPRGALVAILTLVVHVAAAPIASGQSLRAGASGDATSSPSAAPSTQSLDTAVLIIRGLPIAVFRASLGPARPQERASAAVQRFAAATAREVPDSVSVLATSAGQLVRLGSVGLFVLTSADLDPESGETPSQAAAAAAARVRTVSNLVRESRSLPLLLRALAFALLATLLFLGFLRLLVVARRGAAQRVPNATAAGLNDIRLRGFTLLRAEQVIGTLQRGMSLVAWVVGFIAAYLWLTFVLTRFAYSWPWGEALGTYLSTTVKTLALGALTAVPGLFTVVLIVAVTRWLARIVHGFFDAVEARTVEAPWVHPETANPTRRIAVALLWLFAIVVAYPYLPGSGSDVFKGISVFAGLILSLGSSGVMNQAMSGLVLMYSRALKPGDYVLVGDTEGTVTELGMLSTKVLTSKGEVVTLPNAVVAGGKVTNYSRHAEGHGGILLHTAVTIGYDTPWRQVQGMLLTAADRTPGLADEPASFVLQTALSDFYVEYQLNVPLVEPHRRIAVLSTLHGHIADVFNEYGVQITSPHYVADPPVPSIVPPARWRTKPAERAPTD